MRTLIVALIALGIAARPADACALDTSTPFAVSFGSYDVFSNTPLDVAGSISYWCVISLSIRIDISAGSGTYTQRQMPGPAGEKLNYNLYLDAARTRVWGNGTSSSERYGPVIGLLVVTAIPVYGRVFARQDVKAGSYGETLTVTLNF